jgi:hypothetical protein
LGANSASAILIRFENRFVAASTVHDVVERTGIMHTRLARRAGELLQQRQGVNSSSSIAGTDTEPTPFRWGFTNLEEFLSGTSPRDSDSVLAIAVQPISAGVISLTFISAPSRSYTVQYRDNRLVAGKYCARSSRRRTEVPSPCPIH